MGVHFLGPKVGPWEPLKLLDPKLSRMLHGPLGSRAWAFLDPEAQP